MWNPSLALVFSLFYSGSQESAQLFSDFCSVKVVEAMVLSSAFKGGPTYCIKEQRLRDTVETSL
mgnify:FL=1